ncbi:hypothetical protein C2E23DRAFT_63885 [Lenzites betulinus]|nr:hypothetical protein C2E23DRAFT_63885 [Lenzites betulinus]
MKFEIYGSVELGFALQVGTTSSQIMTSSVKWSTVITMSTVDNITIVNSVSQDPVFTEANTAAHPTSWFRDPTLMLRRVFPANVELTEVVQELRAFEGPWQYCRPSMLNPYSLANPAFNEDGDLVFQLQGHRSAPLLQIDSASWSSQPVTAPVAVSPAPRRGKPTIRRPMHSISTRPLNTAITRPPSPSPSSSMIPLSPHDPQADASTVSAMSPAMPTEDVSLSEVKPSEGASRPPSSSVTPSEPPPTITSTLFDTPLVAQTEETHPVIANSIVNPSPGPQEKSSIWKSCVAKLAAGVGWDLDSW